MKHLTHLNLGDRFFVATGIGAVVSAFGFWQPVLFWPAVTWLAAMLLLTLADVYRLYTVTGQVTAVRQPPRVFSLGDTMQVGILLENRSALLLNLTVIDELPEALQVRDHRLVLRLDPGERRTVTYGLRPTTRGRYGFGNLNLFLQTTWRLAERRLVVDHAQEVAVYPSILQMEQFSLRTRGAVPAAGQRRARPVARSYAFDQIKEYVRGDDLRSVNWKATARRGEIMVNQYEVERAQRIYCVIDKGRTMLMPFDGLSLLDHAINASLALSKVILQQQDRAGLLTFSDKLGDALAADGKSDQLRRVLDTLYRQQEREVESDYDLLYYATRRFLPGRSLLLLFTNFESNYALDRVLPALRRIARHHTLVVILFENTEIADLLALPTPDVEAVYLKGSARRYLQERQLMAARLRQNGVQVVLTRPESLTASVIAHYLDIRGRGGI